MFNVMRSSLRFPRAHALLLTLLMLNALWLTFNILPIHGAPGTIIVPDEYPTIQDAINHSIGGDIIFVRDGIYYENIVVNRTVSIVGESKEGTIIDGNHVGVTIQIVAPNVSIRGLTIRNSGYEPYDCGVWITSSNIMIVGNVITETAWGIGLANPSHACIISGNTICGNEHSGGTWGGGLILLEADNNTIVGNTISCIEDYGIYFMGASSHNKILGNTLMNHFRDGIYIKGSNNTLHHNNFMETNNQVTIAGGTDAWDGGYPIGGNFWSDYTGTDLSSGSYQNETGSDGIGDAPHPISENNTDNYPLMQPYGSIKNLDTGLNYVAIQSAIDASDTLNGHTIRVSSGTYYENLIISKSISIVGEGQETTIIHGRSIGNLVNITASNVKLYGFTIQNSGSLQNYGVYISSAGANISYNTIKNNHIGIYIDNCDNNTISKSTIFSNVHGIHVTYSNYTTISYNNLSTNSGFGIALTSSNNCKITSNIAHNNSHSVYIDNYSSNNTVSGNTALNNFYSVYIDNYSSNNTVSGNTALNNFYGIVIYSSSNNNIFHNNIINNTQQAWSFNSTNAWDYDGCGNYWSNYNGTDSDGDGIGDTPMLIDSGDQDSFPLMHPYGFIRNINTGISYMTIQSAISASETLDTHSLFAPTGVYYEELVVNKSILLVGENRETTIIDNTYRTGDVITITANNVTIRNFTIKGSNPLAPSSGICLQSSNYTTIEDNIITNNRKGMYLNNTFNAKIICNIISNNTGECGVYLSESLSNWIEYNTITDNVLGVSLSESGNNTITHNLITYNGHEGIRILGLNANCNVIAHNNVSSNGFNHSLGLDGIYIDLSSNNTFSNNVIALNARNGLNLTKSSNNHLIDNEIFGNEDGAGISLSDLGNSSTNNVIIANTIADNQIGIYLNHSGNNSIYHNNFLNNNNQLTIETPSYENTWDNGCEGNYWSDYWSGYIGIDLDGDGIGDTFLPWKDIDYYPLINPYWNPSDIDHNLKVDIFDIVLACGAYGSTTSDPKWNCHCDIAELYGKINIFDIVMIAVSYGEKLDFSPELPPLIKIDPLVSTVNVSDVFDVNVTMVGVTNLTGWEFKLFYLSSVVNCTGIVEGPFLKQGGSTFKVFDIINDFNGTHGRILAGCILLGPTSVSGSGTLAIITFEAVGGGETPLDLMGTKLSDEQDPPQPISHLAVDGTTTVELAMFHTYVAASEYEDSASSSSHLDKLWWCPSKNLHVHSILVKKCIRNIMANGKKRAENG